MKNLRVWESKRLKLFKERIKLSWNYQRENKIFPGKFFLSQILFITIIIIIIIIIMIMIIIFFLGGGGFNSYDFFGQWW